MAGVEPSPGYSILAAALAQQSPRHNVVITTNFDNLVADALAIYTDVFPFVCGHESLAGFVRVAMRRPMICKIHRDLLLGPQNDRRSLMRLHDAWGAALRALFLHYTPLIIGYGGNDGTLMDLLNSLSPGEIKGQLIWCHYDNPERSSVPSDEIQSLVEAHNGLLVPVPDFDSLMVLLGAKMSIGMLDEVVIQRANKRTDRYRERIVYLDTVRNTDVVDALKDIYERSGGWWVWQRKASRERDANMRKAIYLQGIQRYPKSGMLLAEYAQFLGDFKSPVAEVERRFQEALSYEPRNARILGMYALFLAGQPFRGEDAEKVYRRALDVDSNAGWIVANFATFLRSQPERSNEAREHFVQAINLKPGDARIINNYANFLYDEKDFDEAEKYYALAIELEPDEQADRASLLGNYAAFLANVRADIAAAERYYREAIQLHGQNATLLAKFARFLSKEKESHEEAEKLYKEAVKLDPGNVKAVGGYANFLLLMDRRLDTAESLYRKALAIAPNEARWHANYACLLIGCSRLSEAGEQVALAEQLHRGNKDQLAAEMAFYALALARLRREVKKSHLDTLRRAIRSSYERTRWCLDATLRPIRKTLPKKEVERFEAVAAGVLDEKKVPIAVQSLDNWPLRNGQAHGKRKLGRNVRVRRP